jgi:hypothetical protein
VAGDDPAEPARVTVALVGREWAFAAQAQLPAPRDLADLGPEARRAAVARGRLCGALVVECDEKRSGLKRGGAARQEAPVGISPGSILRALCAAFTDLN